MTFKLKNVRRAWREKKWQMRRAALARLAELGVWIQKDKSERGRVFLASKAILVAPVRCVGACARALAKGILGANAGWSILRGQLSWREKFELEKVAKSDGLDGPPNLDRWIKILQNQRKARGSSKFLGKLLARVAQKSEPNINVIKSLIDARASLVERWDRVGVLEEMDLQSESSKDAFRELISAGARPAVWTKREEKSRFKANETLRRMGRSQKWDSALGGVVAQGWVEGIEALVPLTDVKDADEQAGGLLAWACKRRRGEMDSLQARAGARRTISALVGAGADINKLDENGMSALSIALGRRDIVWAEELLRAGAIVDASRQSFPSMGVSDLAIWATNHVFGDQESEPLDSDESFLELKGFVDLLVGKGAQLGSYARNWDNKHSTECLSAIHWAVSKSNLGLLKILLPLCGATNAERAEVLDERFIVFKREKESGPIVATSGRTAFWIAVSSGNVTAARMLLDAGATLPAADDIASNKNEENPVSLLANAATASPRMVEFVLGLMEHTQEQHDEAFWWGSGVSVSILEKLSPSSMSVELHGKSCLERAILWQKQQDFISEDREMARWLIERGAAAAATLRRDDEALSLFNLAKSFQQPRWVEMQIQAGADVWMLDADGDSTLDCAGRNIFQSRRVSMYAVGGGYGTLEGNSGKEVASAIFTKMLENPRRALLYAKRAASRLRKHVEARNATGNQARAGEVDMIEFMERLATVAADKLALTEASGAMAEQLGRRARPRL